MKLIAKGLILVSVFFMLWFLLSRIDWIEHLQVRVISRSVEKKIGELSFTIIKGSHDEISDSFSIQVVDSLLQIICLKNQIDRQGISLHLIKTTEANAVALPDRKLVIYTGLISKSSDQEELCGVICHELAHIEHHHVMQKLIREAGFLILLNSTGSQIGAELAKEIAKILSTSAFDRALEKDADLTAVQYMQHAGLSGKALSTFIKRLSSDYPAENTLSWISTHPASNEREAYILEASLISQKRSIPIVSNMSWSELRKRIQQ